MDRFEITTAQNVGIEFQAAGIGDRTMATVIDYSIIIAYIMTAMLLIQGFGDDAEQFGFSIMYILFLPYLLYFPVSEIFFNGQSIGKKMSGLKVTRLDGTTPSLGDYVIRALFRLIEIDMSAGLIAVLTVLIRGKGQRLGDIAAHTTVVKLTQAVSLEDTVYTKIDETYQPVYPEAAALTAQDITLIKEVVENLNRHIEKEQWQIADRLGTRIKNNLEHRLGITSALVPIDFLETLLKDYNRLKYRT